MSDERVSSLTNGPGAAAVLAAGMGSFALGVLTVAGDKLPKVRAAMNFYRPTGPLSGVTTVTIAVWLLAWVLLEWRWGKKSVRLAQVNGVALALLCLGLLLTFPPVIDLF